MRKQHYQPETGCIQINGKKLSWTMKRTKTSSAFGIRGSRIFELELKENDKLIGVYQRGWSKLIAKEDEEGALALEHILNTYGKDPARKKKEMGSSV